MMSSVTNGELRWRPLVAAGVASGLAQVAAGVAMYVAGVYFDPVSFLVSMLVLAVGVVGGTSWYRKHVPLGCTTYRSALLIGIAISVYTGLTYALYNVVSVSFVYPHFLEDLVQARLARLQARGLVPSQMHAQLAAIQARTTIARLALANLIGLSVAGTVLSAVAAVAFRRRRVGAQGHFAEHEPR
jgi:hypothetical protein